MDKERSDKSTIKEPQALQEITIFVRNLAAKYINLESPIKPSTSREKFVTVEASINEPVKWRNVPLTEKKITIWQNADTIHLSISRDNNDDKSATFECFVFSDTGRVDVYFYKEFKWEEGNLKGKEAFDRAKKLGFI